MSRRPQPSPAPSPIGLNSIPWSINQELDDCNWSGPGNGGDFVLFDTPNPVPTIKADDRLMSSFEYNNQSNNDWGSAAPSPAPLFYNNFIPRRNSADSGISASLIETPAQSPMMGREAFEDYRRGAGSFDQHLSPPTLGRDGGAGFSGDSAVCNIDYQISPFMGHDDSELSLFPPLDMKPAGKFFPDLEPVVSTRPSLQVEYSNMSLDGMLPGASKGSPVLEPAVPTGRPQMIIAMASYKTISTHILMNLTRTKGLEQLRPIFSGITDKLMNGQHSTLRDVEKEILGLTKETCSAQEYQLVCEKYLEHSEKVWHTIIPEDQAGVCEAQYSTEYFSTLWKHVIERLSKEFGLSNSELVLIMEGHRSESPNSRIAAGAAPHKPEPTPPAVTVSPNTRTTRAASDSSVANPHGHGHRASLMSPPKRPSLFEPSSAPMNISINTSTSPNMALGNQSSPSSASPSSLAPPSRRTSIGKAARSPRTLDYRVTPYEKFPCPQCDKTFGRQCDLRKHQKTHDRPHKCPEDSCKYHIEGFSAEKDRDRHWSDRHDENAKRIKCHYGDCSYSSTRESNVKQHMEKTHNYVYNRTKVVQKKAKNPPVKAAPKKTAVKPTIPRQTPQSTPLNNPLATPNIGYYSASTSPGTIEASPIAELMTSLSPIAPTLQSISPSVIDHQNFSPTQQINSYFFPHDTPQHHTNGYPTPQAAVMAMNQQVHTGPPHTFAHHNSPHQQIHHTHSHHNSPHINGSGDFHETLLGGYEQSPSSDEDFANHFLGDAPEVLRAQFGMAGAGAAMGGGTQERFAGYPVVKEPFDNELDVKVAGLAGAF